MCPNIRSVRQISTQRTMCPRSAGRSSLGRAWYFLFQAVVFPAAPLLVVLAPVPDLSLFAKYLFSAAMMGFQRPTTLVTFTLGCYDRKRYPSVSDQSIRRRPRFCQQDE